MNTGFSLNRLFKIKEDMPKVYPTWEEFHIMFEILSEMELSEYEHCKGLFDELYDCKVFNSEEKSLSMRLDNLIQLLTDISTRVRVLCDTINVLRGSLGDIQKGGVN